MKGPVLIDLEGEDIAKPDVAPAVIDEDAAPHGVAMQQVAALATKRPSRLTRWFWGV